MIKALAVAGVALAVPFVSLAATYLYVDMNGDVQEMEASSEQEALVTAPNISVHSGVSIDSQILDEESVDVGDTYRYTSATGETKTVIAATYADAELLATDRSPSSMLVLVAAE